MSEKSVGSPNERRRVFSFGRSIYQIQRAAVSVARRAFAYSVYLTSKVLLSTSGVAYWLWPANGKCSPFKGTDPALPASEFPTSSQDSESWWAIASGSRFAGERRRCKRVSSGEIERRNSPRSVFVARQLITQTWPSLRIPLQPLCEYQ
jgi:hypothetical protein